MKKKEEKGIHHVAKGKKKGPWNLPPQRGEGKKSHILFCREGKKKGKSTRFFLQTPRGEGRGE